MSEEAKPMDKQNEIERCELCHNPGRHRIGTPYVALCGIHANQLKKMCRGIDSNELTRTQIRLAFGFIYPEM